MDSFVGIRALLSIPRVGNKTINRMVSVLESMSSADEYALDQAVRREATASSRIHYAGRESLHEALLEAEQHRDIMAAPGVHALTQENADYPRALIGLPDSPAILYARGNLSLMQANLSVAFVGTRKPTDFAARALHRLAYRLGAVSRIGGATEKAGEQLNGAKVVPLCARLKLAHGHILQHTLAQWADRFVRLGHGSYSCVVVCLCRNNNLNTGKAQLRNLSQVQFGTSLLPPTARAV
jgi:hypothetical protein